MNVLTQIASGNQEAVRLCVEKYNGLLWSIVRRYIQSQAEAEEIIQEVFAEVWQHASRYDPDKGDEAVFVATIARRRSIDRLRSNNARPRTESIDGVIDVVDAMSVQCKQEIQADSDVVIKQMNQLDEESRRFILLNVMYGYSHGEIASMTGAPLGSVKTQIRRGLNIMKQAFAEAQQKTIRGRV